MTLALEQSEVDQLKDLLDTREKNLNPAEWMNSLDSRKREESTFHDKVRHIEPVADMTKAAEVGSRKNSSFYDTAEASFAHSREWIQKQTPGKIVLDYACGNGGNAIRMAEAGASLSIGIDISPTSVHNARTVAKEKNLQKNMRFFVGDCEKTGLPDNSVDRIVCMGCLHHLDLSYALPELRRILKPGGRVFVHESLAYNPMIMLYRRFTPHLRTAFEKDHILSFKEIAFAKRFFQVENLKFFHFFSIGAIPLGRGRLFRIALAVADRLDRIFLSIKPFSFLAWQFSFELVKKERT